MQYIALIYEHAGGVENLSEADHQVLIDQHNELIRQAKEAQVYLGASELKPAASASSVRIRNGTPVVTDGPFAEAKELFVGFYLFDCPDLDAALHWASMIPTASNSGVEVRPLDDPNCGAGAPVEAIAVDSDKSLYALLNYLDEGLLEAYSEEDTQQLIAENTAMANHARAAGEYISGGKLMPPATATTISHAEGKQQILDGPFAEAKEVLLGFHMVAGDSIGKAIDYAKRIPDARAGVVEVRPVQFHEQVGEQAIQWNSSE
ncbi:MAG: YciI family protein [Chromatiales bacterium]|nr:YciI family protein [Chromatiales bacterium]